MRRPLLAVCLCLVLVTAIHLLLTDSLEQTPKWWSRDMWPWEEDMWQAAFPEAYEGQEITVIGRVYQKNENYYYIDSIQILETVVNLRQKKSIDDNLILERPQGSNALLGSVIVVRGTFETYAEATNPGEFDARTYYRSIGVGGLLKNVKIVGTSKEYSELKEILHQLREYFVLRLYQIFPEKEASVMCAILLGEKSGLDKDLKDLYQRNGMIHILSISGLHISIIGMSLFKLLKKVGVPIWLAAVCGGMILWLYGMMTGMGISACRAIGMYLIRMLGVCMGRTYDMMTAWGVVGVLMVVGNPYYLQHSGFLMSYASVLGIGVLFPVLQEIFKTVEVKTIEENEWKAVRQRVLRKVGEGLKQSMLAGGSVTIMTLPILLWFYYEVPVFSVILNLVVIPLMSLLMVTGMLAMLVPGLGVVGMVDVLILKWYEYCCHFFEGLPFHNWNPGRPESWQVVVYYAILFGLLWWYVVWRERIGKEERMGKKKRVGKEKIGVFLALTAMVIVMSGASISHHTVTFLDVGQGDCICLQTKGGKVYLFDCGSTSRSKVGTYVLKPFLKYNGISRVDAVFLSHSDEDHCSGIEELLEMQEEWGIIVEKVVVSECDKETYWEYNNLVSGTKVHSISAGVAWEVEDIEFRCLHPEADFEAEDSNAVSQCYYVDFGECSLLLTGDVEGAGEQQLIQAIEKYGISEDISSDFTVLKVAHHGSKYSTSEELLRQTGPGMSVISCGRNNVYGHPHAETLKRLEEVGSVVLTTPEYGAITIEVTLSGVSVSYWGNGKVRN
ncbi:MAG: DNA internalization-related competence protein ComEC/Rec2 [Lachnospiraceae bacterium]|nr:DNA internalization-related competence protein ComEC/Rec2 [Lachnospiraceae bacterium]